MQATDVQHIEIDPCAFDSERPGLILRRFKGHYTAHGHEFGDEMTCIFCGETWDNHQESPGECIHAHDVERERLVLPDVSRFCRVGTRVAARRAQLGLTQTQLGRSLGTTQTAVCRFESSLRLSDALLSRLSLALSVPEHWLRGAEES